jgi:hypothetical protein
MKKIRLQDRAELKEFTKPNTIKGKETKAEVLARLGLTPEVKTAPKYITKGGQVYKMVDGNAVPLKKVVK